MAWKLACESLRRRTTELKKLKYVSNLRMGLCEKHAKSIGWRTFTPLDSDLS